MPTVTIVNQIQSDLVTYTLTISDSANLNAVAGQDVVRGEAAIGTPEFNARMQIVADAIEEAVRNLSEFAIRDLNYANTWVYTPTNDVQGSLMVSFTIAGATLVINASVETALTGEDLDALIQAKAVETIADFKDNPSYQLTDIVE